jgi:hypothetical protein
MTVLLVVAIKKFSEFFGPNECCACHFEFLPDYQNFLREASFPIIRTPNADGTGAAFFLFFSAFGFFFSRLLLNWPFAILSSFACGEYGV